MEAVEDVNQMNLILTPGQSANFVQRKVKGLDSFLRTGAMGHKSRREELEV